MKTINDQSLISDDQSLVSAVNQFGRELRIYDDGFGPLWIHRDSMGVSGVVRAMTWEDAYAICEDEFFPAADDDAAKDYKRIESMSKGKERDHEQACFEEAYGYRNNSRKENDGTLSSVYMRDLSGDSLDLLTKGLANELGLTIKAESNV